MKTTTLSIKEALTKKTWWAAHFQSPMSRSLTYNTTYFPSTQASRAWTKVVESVSPLAQVSRLCQMEVFASTRSRSKTSWSRGRRKLDSWWWASSSTTCSNRYIMVHRSSSTRFLSPLITDWSASNRTFWSRQRRPTTSTASSRRPSCTRFSIKTVQIVQK